MEVRRQGQAAGPVPVTRQDDDTVGVERRAAPEDPGQMPAHQIGHQVAQVRHEGRGHGRTVRGGHLGGVEGHVDLCHRESTTPVTGQPAFRGPFDHPVRHGVPAGPPQAGDVLRGEEPLPGAGRRTGPHR
jgi:hypothetical protein